MKQILDPYIQSGQVVYTYFPGKARHLDAFNDAIAKYKMKTKYMAFIDVDEFLLPENKGDDLVTLIEKIMKKILEVAVLRSTGECMALLVMSKCLKDLLRNITCTEVIPMQKETIV